ncbi:MAG: hypothetical protein K8T91_05190 [Planctomycetes bacterium]|nr:hypothetical protein [Planctomycetota bacterium]
MTLDDVLPKILSLSRVDRLQLVRLLVADLAQEDEVPLFIEGQDYPVWSPFDSTEAAVILEQALNEHRGST